MGIIFVLYLKKTLFTDRRTWFLACLVNCLPCDFRWSILCI